MTEIETLDEGMGAARRPFVEREGESDISAFACKAVEEENRTRDISWGLGRTRNRLKSNLMDRERGKGKELVGLLPARKERNIRFLSTHVST